MKKIRFSSATVLLLTLTALSALAQNRTTPEAGEGFDNQACRTNGTGMHEVRVSVSKKGNGHTLASPATVDHITSGGYAPAPEEFEC